VTNSVKRVSHAQTVSTERRRRTRAFLAKQSLGSHSGRHSAVKTSQCFAFMQRYVIGPVVLDFVLRVILARMMDVAFVVYVLRMHSHDAATDTASFGIPTHVIADLEHPSHDIYSATRPKNT
jgi:hypothetical protein